MCTSCIARPNGTRLILEHKSRIISEHKNWLKSEHENRIISENTDKQKHRQEPLHTEIYRKNATAQNLGPCFVRACAVEMQFDVSQEPLYNLYMKNAAAQTEPRTQTRFVGACAVEMHFNMSQEPLYTEIYRKNAAPQSAQNTNTHFVQACAIEMHLNISQEPLYTKIYRKNAGAQSGHPDQAPAFTPTVRTPQCGHTVWGKKETKTDTAKSETRKPGNYDARKLEPRETRRPGNQETRRPGNQENQITKK